MSLGKKQTAWKLFQAVSEIRVGNAEEYSFSGLFPVVLPREINPFCTARLLD
jgi:hypothetical protein